MNGYGESELKIVVGEKPGIPSEQIAAASDEQDDSQGSPDGEFQHQETQSLDAGALIGFLGLFQATCDSCAVADILYCGDHLGGGDVAGVERDGGLFGGEVDGSLGDTGDGSDGAVDGHDAGGAGHA